MPGILLVDDNAEILENTAELLGLMDYTVYKAKNGVQGLEMAREHRPKLIISDVIMPKMDGLEMLKALKADPEMASIPVILITARVDKASMEEAVKLGAATYLTKPFSNEDLLQIVATYMDS